MKRTEIIRAFRALLRLKDTDMPIRCAWGIYWLVEQLKPLYDSTTELEAVLFEKYGGSVIEGNITFPNTESADAFMHEYNKMSNEDLDTKIRKVVVNFNEIGNAIMTPADIAFLHDIIQFE